MIKAAFAYLVTFFFLAYPHDQENILFQEITGKVIVIKDGDTIEILFNNKPLTIRLAHIDCPELKRNQPYSRVAKKFTSDLCFGQVVAILNSGKYDRNGRLIGEVINSRGINVNKELVKAGLAWHFKKYSADKTYARLETVAKKNKKGLWADMNPIAPWDWRNASFHKHAVKVTS